MLHFRDGQWSDRDNFASLVEELAKEFQPRLGIQHLDY
jgi:hypothetical protein